VAFSRSGLYLATCGRDKSVWIWECKQADTHRYHHQLALFVLDNEEENDFACAAVLTTHTQDVKQLKWHPQKDVRTPVTCLHQRH
jgi:cytosolic iron-sulfur protein assembly protein CIAO1